MLVIDSGNAVGLSAARIVHFVLRRIAENNSMMISCIEVVFVPWPCPGGIGDAHSHTS